MTTTWSGLWTGIFLALITVGLLGLIGNILVVEGIFLFGFPIGGLIYDFSQKKRK